MTSNASSGDVDDGEGHGGSPNEWREEWEDARRVSKVSHRPMRTDGVGGTAEYLRNMMAQAVASDRAGRWPEAALWWRDIATELGRTLREIADTSIAGDVIDGAEYESSDNEECVQLYSIVTRIRVLLGDDRGRP